MLNMEQKCALENFTCTLVDPYALPLHLKLQLWNNCCWR